MYVPSHRRRQQQQRSSRQSATNRNASDSDNASHNSGGNVIRSINKSSSSSGSTTTTFNKMVSTIVSPNHLRGGQVLPSVSGSRHIVHVRRVLHLHLQTLSRKLGLIAADKEKPAMSSPCAKIVGEKLFVRTPTGGADEEEGESATQCQRLDGSC